MYFGCTKIINVIIHQFQFFNENGFVAVKVLSQEECDKSIDDIWNYLESPSLTSKNIVDRNDPTTWKDQNWKGMISEGILGPRLAFSHCALSIRQHPNVYQVFSDILGTEKIMSNHDRFLLLLYNYAKRIQLIDFLNLFQIWSLQTNKRC